jgi:beta-xylosidase
MIIRRAILASALLILGAEAADNPYVSRVWVADNRDGTYKNPILNADYSDPDVVRVGDDFFMTASSFTCVPGLPVLHSRDLVNWTLIGHALNNQIPEDVFDKPQHGKGVWAPAIRFHNGRFYIYYPDPDFGVYVTRATDPAGEWEKPVRVLAGKGIIDPAPLWDDDGSVYLVHAWANSRAGVDSLLTVNRMNAEGTQVIDEGRNVFDGHDQNPTVEGPKFYKRNGFYYLFAPAGGVPGGWQLALRSRNVYGPYEEKIVLRQGKTNINGPHQGAWVETASGESWFVHFQDRGAYGRVVHLQPVKWVNDWPVMGNDGEPVASFKKPAVSGAAAVATPRESDEFDGGALGLQWQWQANPRVVWHALIPGSGRLRLFSIRKPKDAKTLADLPNLLLQKFPAPDFTATTKLTLTPAGDGKQAGLVIMGNDYAALTLSAAGKGFRLAQSVCLNATRGGAERIAAETPVAAATVHLRVKVSAPDARCRFSYSLDGVRFTDFGEEFQAKPGGWIGAKVGLFSVKEMEAADGGYADFDWFRIE